MKVRIAKNKQEFAEFAFEEMIDVIKNKPDAILGLATGSTPICLYEKMIEDHKANRTTYKDIHSFNLDEYVGLDISNDQSYVYFMNDNLFKGIDIDKNNTNFLNGMAKDVDKECARYSKLLSENEIDIQLLGIGSNGHIAFNEPGTSFDSKAHKVDLQESTIKDNSRFFESIATTPTQALTMGLSEIMKAKKVLLMANGKNKADAIYGLVKGQMTENLPASILQNHPNCVVVVDEEAGSKL